MSLEDGDNGEGASVPLRIVEPAEAQPEDDSELEDDPVLSRNADSALLAGEDFLSDNSTAQYY